MVSSFTRPVLTGPWQEKANVAKPRARAARPPSRAGARGCGGCIERIRIWR